MSSGVSWMPRARSHLRAFALALYSAWNAPHHAPCPQPTWFQCISDELFHVRVSPTPTLWAYHCILLLGNHRNISEATESHRAWVQPPRKVSLPAASLSSGRWDLMNKYPACQLSVRQSWGEFSMGPQRLSKEPSPVAHSSKQLINAVSVLFSHFPVSLFLTSYFCLLGSSFQYQISNIHFFMTI